MGIYRTGLRFSGALGRHQSGPLIMGSSLMKNNEKLIIRPLFI